MVSDNLVEGLNDLSDHLIGSEEIGPGSSEIQLYRSLMAIANFSVSFSVVSVLTGLNTMYGDGLRYGGPLTMIYGFPIVGLLTLIVGLSMAEICSAYPTSGGLYFWSAKLCGKRWGPLASWLTGWFNIVGQWAVTTSVDFSLAQLISVIILLSTGGKNGGGYEASKYVIMCFHGGILLLHAIINSLPISVMSFFGQVAAAWNLLGVLLLMILIPSVAKHKASAEFVFTHFNTDTGEGIDNGVYIFVLGLLVSQYTLLGYDASAHMSLESYVAFEAMVSIATIGSYIAYALPTLFRVTLARKSFVPGPFNLGRFSILAGWVAVLWVITISVLFSLPVAYPITTETLNYAPVAVGGLLILTVSAWVLSARHWFTGPITNIDNS
ncbi:hypothetical protein CDL15_Pgr017598 [Punica granatum]|uniref:Amino-acid permease BAT1 homolog n=1 Tax=Punica granatum TaxID=22663 RepID=A0A218W6V6_PUNGR|nr:hypothetical protein CDL15_Pgr017598 [Punica granatum]